MRWSSHANVLLILATLFVADRANGQTLSRNTPSDWNAVSPREEIRPKFEIIESSDGPQLTIRADQRAGLSGHWQTHTPITGGRYYHFSAKRRTEGVKHPRRTGVARILWRDSKGAAVQHAEPAVDSYRRGERPRAEPEFPAVTTTQHDWDTLEGTYLAPPEATQAIIELCFRWGAPESAVHWKQVELKEVPRPEPRLVRLATIHHQPRGGKTAREKCEQFAPLIAEAAAQQADLVVLPETLTYYASGGTYADAAEPIPGPSTEYFGQLAKRHDLYLVAGLLERDAHLIYNVAVLIGPDGQIVGKYRKVCLPRGEIEGGITPGTDYPVFETRFGRVGMMVCYDGFFPEVARELSNRGADVIAWPVWGCNPLLGQARACENHVYVISSTYTKVGDHWMRSAIYDHNGEMLAAAEEFGTVVVAEVDLSKPHHWHSLGDFKAQLPAHRPIAASE